MMPEPSTLDFLNVACQVCEHGSALERFRHIIFERGAMRAFNGVAYYEAASEFDATEHFAINELKLEQALRATIDNEVTVKTNAEFIILKQGKLTVRVRKLPPDEVDHPHPPRISKDLKVKLNFRAALEAVAPFVSSDASRPWSVSVLIKDGYLWATNNLSMVRSPIEDKKLKGRIPGAVIPLLLMLPKFDAVALNDQLMSVWYGRSLLTFPQSLGEWPEVDHFYANRAKKLPKIEDDMLAAARTVEKFADRFVTLTDTNVAGKMATIESEYEVAIMKGKGTYSARLLSLVLSHATHADFSKYPEPVPFESSLLEGVAVGVRPEFAQA